MTATRRSGRRGEPARTHDVPARGDGERTRGERFDQTVATWATLLAPLTLAGAMALCLVGYGSASDRSTRIGVLVIPVLCVVVWPAIRAVTRAEGRPHLAPLLWLSFGLHAIASVFRTANAADSLEYHREGTRLAALFSDGQFVVDTGRPVPGTGTMRYLAGLVHLVTGSNMYATLLVFTTLAFFALLVFLRAFSIGMPDGRRGEPAADRRRYALLLLLWPSLAFWPSSLGKEAWMTFTMSVVALGAARWFTHRRLGITLVAVGVFGTFMVRPHVALILVIAVGVAFLFRAPTDGSNVKVTGKVIGIVVLLAAGGVLATQTAQFLGVENLASDGVDQVLETVGERTTQGGASFTPARVTSPLAYPWATFTVLVRPLPTEVDNIEGAISAFEGMVLLVVLALSVRRMLTVPRLAVTVSYVALALAFTAMFVFAFAVIGNFGILARQRTQVLPFLFVLLSVPPPIPRPDRPRGRAAQRMETGRRSVDGRTITHRDRDPARSRMPAWRPNALWTPDETGLAVRNAPPERATRPPRRPGRGPEPNQ